MPTNPMNSVIERLRRAMLRGRVGLGDRELLGCFIERHDEAAFAALVHRHGPMVWGVCRRLLSHHDAEDAFQATFLVLVRKAASIVPREMVGNWLYGVAHQAALQARRTAARRRAREVQVTVMPDTETVRQGQWPDVQPLLDQELSRLPNNYRAVIVLCDLEGRTRKEVARQLGVPEGTVAGRLARARAMLAKRLTERGVTLSAGALAAVLARNVAAAGVPDSVVCSTISAAGFLAAGDVAAAAPVSGKVAALTEGVLKAMMMSKLKAVVAVALVLGFILTGATVLCCRTVSAQGDQAPAVEEQAKVPQKQEEKEGFTAWGKEAGGLQAGLGYRPGEHRTYCTGETATVVLRVRSVSKEAVKFQYYRQFFMENPPAVTDGGGKPVRLRSEQDAEDVEVRLPVDVNLAPGKEIEIAELKFTLRPASESGNKDFSTSYGTRVSIQYDLYGTGKFTVQYERVFGATSQGAFKLDPALTNLGTGKLELEVKDAEKTPQKQEKEKEVFTAWGKKTGGLQAGLSYLPGQHRTYHTGETVTLVVRVRNVSKEAVKFQYDPWFFIQRSPAVTDSAGKPVDFRYGLLDTALVHPPTNVSLAPGKEKVLGEVKLPTTLFGTGKFTVQYERVFGKSYQGTLEVDPTLKDLGTGKLDLEIKSEPPPAATEKKAPEKQDQEKEGFTAWGKEAGGLQAGLGYAPGQHRTYHTGETVTLVVRVRNVSEEVVEFQYDPWFFVQKAPAVTDSAGKPVVFRYGVDDTAQVHRPTNVSLPPGKEKVLGEVKFPTAILGTGKFTVQYERVFGKSYQGTLEVDPTLRDLGTDKLDLEIKSKPPRLKVGEAAPGLYLHYADGNIVPQKSMDGKCLLVTFWSVASLKSAEGASLFEQMKKVRRDIADRDDFILISVCVDAIDDDKKMEAWSQFLLSPGTVDYGDGRRRFIDDSRWWGCTEVGLDEPTSRRYGVDRYPESFLIGADGKLAAVSIPHKNLREAVAKSLKLAR
jgi:RNA polymerase sigma factor (sigma-70 family)